LPQVSRVEIERRAQLERVRDRATIIHGIADHADRQRALEPASQPDLDDWWADAEVWGQERVAKVEPQ
jgi:hypothetical protein